MTVTVEGGRYLPPVAGHYLFDMTSTQAAALTLDAAEGGLSEVNHFPFKLSTKHVATFATTVKAQAPKLSFSASTGTFSGSFQVLDTEIVNGKTVITRRTATVAGVLLSPAGLEPAAMLGHFFLPGLMPTPTTSPILGGAVEVSGF